MKILTVVGARPQFVKAAVVSDALRRTGRVREVLVHTGQHYDENMSAIFFEQLGLRPADQNLGVGSGPHGKQTGEMMAGLESVALEERPDWVLIYGDTNSTLAGALVGAKLHLPIAHVEAGLRSYTRQMPEEVNRVVADVLSTALFCPTRTAVANLEREGIVRGVHRVGDVMLDVLQRSRVNTERNDILPRLGLHPGGYFLATIHRAENTGDPALLLRLLAALEQLPCPVVFPVHPRTRTALTAAGWTPGRSAVRTVEPVGYLEMLALEAGARAVLTDSGGVQKEAFFLRRLCVTLREETEWPETLGDGWNVLAGSEPERIVAAAVREPPPTWRVGDFGDGRAAERIAERLVLGPGSG